MRETIETHFLLAPAELRSPRRIDEKVRSDEFLPHESQHQVGIGAGVRGEVKRRTDLAVFDSMPLAAVHYAARVRTVY